MSLVKLVDPVAAGDLGRVHFIGIGGSGMSGIARILLKRGVPVSGSDARGSDMVTELRDLGARVNIGHAASHVKHVDTVVVSTAIRDSNPELAFMDINPATRGHAARRPARARDRPARGPGRGPRGVRADGAAARRRAPRSGSEPTA